MIKDYRADLERAARLMILVRNVDTLSRLIIRTIQRKVGVRHAGLFLFDKRKQEYIVMVSRGESDIKIPAGFTKIGRTNPMIRFFTDSSLRGFDRDFLLGDRIDGYMAQAAEQPLTAEFLRDLKDEMDLYQAGVLVPGFYRKDLIAVFFLGEKKDRAAFTPDELGFLSVLASDVVMAIQNAWYFEDLKAQLEANKQLFLGTVTSMAAAIEAKDKYTSGHTERVVQYSMMIARHMKDARVTAGFLENMRIAALLHDIGKIGVPEKVLNKEGPLDDAEFKIIAQHPDIGSKILGNSAEFSDVIVGVKYHHERFDGRGYPCKLAGEQIPLTAAIIAVADTFDAMTSDRPYRKALPEETAIREIQLNSGKQFHPGAVEAFIEAWKEHKRRAAEETAPAAIEEPKGDYEGQAPSAGLGAV